MDRSNSIALLDDTLKAAIKDRASDIHFELLDNSLNIRFRLDGILINYKVLSKDLGSQILARIKILSGLDIAEKRVPQDGKFFSEKYLFPTDFRVSTFPGVYGEKIVVRILRRDFEEYSLESLGLSYNLSKKIRKLIIKTTGFFLVVGPTGSGKTTTLYSIIKLLNSPEKNLITLEDPVEYDIKNVTQGQINNQIGFTFKKGLRSILRQDPDIIMVGEIRDTETAQIAIQAALTGHFLLSSLHTSDSASTVIRLLDMGVPAFLINASLTGILSQRLVRVLCENCKFESSIKKEDREFLDYINVSVTKNFSSSGCNKCNHTGYNGRTGVFELLILSQELKKLINSRPSYEKLRTCSIKDGMLSMKIDAANKIESGITSVSEFERAVW